MFLVNLESVAVLHFETVGIVRWLDALPIEQEAHTLDALALAVTECIHELLKLGGSLDLEKDFIVVVRDLDV